MNKNKVHIIDPPRYPKLIIPLEEEMKKRFNITLDKIKVDIGKELVQEIKK